ncbi:hypothetical protein PV735_31680 [Streptomyces turgidiscabies]|uniref:DUF6907 domain-containing protein n=1 Tax=Streptomyces turgidiscabies TaxID=85558 RepID=UPI0029A8270E|nr:hypothetical protein [Streptomyces turgidiscabies]MDX3497213.1 hypothetical protein [Streptomyces turgidiscabies]
MSTEPRMVDVTVIETRIVPIPEPDWCVDPHDGAQYFTDLTHNGSETAATIDTRRGEVRFLAAWISQAPYLVSTPELHPVVSIELDSGSYDFDANDVHRLTAVLRARADELDELAAQALRYRGGDQ